MIVWGGIGANGYLNSGARFSPLTQVWTALTEDQRAVGPLLRDERVDRQRDDRLGRPQRERQQPDALRHGRALQALDQRLDDHDHIQRAPGLLQPHGRLDGFEMIVWGGWGGKTVDWSALQRRPVQPRHQHLDGDRRSWLTECAPSTRQSGRAAT